MEAAEELTEPDRGSALEPVQPGDIIHDRYEVLELIAVGGMGRVYLARHVNLETLVAVKILRAELATDELMRAVFLREARAQAQLQSPHVCRVHDLGVLATGAPYLVMDYLMGPDLGRVLARKRKLPIPIATEIVAQAAEGLACAHAAGIVHRDTKPENMILLREQGGCGFTVKLVDFGIAKQRKRPLSTRSMTLSTRGSMGSPNYMAPEQFSSPGSEDLRTDVWALGAVLYECVTGRRPSSSLRGRDDYGSVCQSHGGNSAPCSGPASRRTQGLGDHHRTLPAPRPHRALFIGSGGGARPAQLQSSRNRGGGRAQHGRSNFGERDPRHPAALASWRCNYRGRHCWVGHLRSQSAVRRELRTLPPLHSGEHRSGSYGAGVGRRR